MRIGHYIPGLANPGGIRRYIGRVVEAQERAGHDVVLFDPSPVQVTAGGGAAVEAAGEGEEGDVLAGGEGMRVDVLHAHKPLARGSSRVPLIRTVHEHTP